MPPVSNINSVLSLKIDLDTSNDKSKVKQETKFGSLVLVVQGVPKEHSKDLKLRLNLWSVFFRDTLYYFIYLFLISSHSLLVRPSTISHGREQSSEDDWSIENTPGRDPLVVDGGISSLGRQVLLVGH